MQANLDYLTGLFARGSADGDTLVWDAASGAYVPGSPVPVGTIFMYAGDSTGLAAQGWLGCYGQAVSRTTYAALFGVIGTTYGAGDGSTTFNLPDIQGRVPVGWGSHTLVDTLGKNDGVAMPSRSPRHMHGVNDPQHRHTTPLYNSGAATGDINRIGVHDQAGAGATVTSNYSPTGITVGVQVAGEPVDAVPWLTLDFMIKF